MTINNFLLSLVNSAIEITFFYRIILSLLQKKYEPELYQHLFCLVLIIANILVDIPVKNEVVYTAFSIFFLFLITLAVSRESFLHSLYLLMISYSITLLLQLLLMIPFYFLLTDSGKPVIMLTGNLLTLVMVLIVCKLLPIHYIYDFILAKDVYFRLILSNLLISVVSNTILLFPIIAVYLTLVVIFNIIFIDSKSKLANQENIIQSYNEYLPVVEELIKQVRERQHQYKNDLASLNALTLTCNDYETLCAELSKNIHLLSADATPSFLLAFNLKLMSGFLYSQYTKANSKGIHMSFHIKNYNIQTTFPEYRLTQAIGILTDNAIEACIAEDTIFIGIDCINHQFIFSISNPGPTITPDLLANLFKEGYSTKNRHFTNQGIGLCTLKKMLNEHNGSILVQNKLIDERTYIKFTIKC